MHLREVPLVLKTKSMRKHTMVLTGSLTHHTPGTTVQSVFFNPHGFLEKANYSSFIAATFIEK